MQKSKRITQFSDNGFNISFRLNTIGHITVRSDINIYDEHSKKRIEKWRENNEETVKNYYKNYYQRNIEEVKERVKQWCIDNPEKSRKIQVKRKAKRREFGFKPINDWFKNSNYHHLHIDNDHDVGIFIPTELHKGIPHSHKNKESMDNINKVALEWFRNNEIDKQQ